MGLKVGIQLYSVRNALREDPYGTLAKVAEAGFRYVEAANHSADVDDGVGFGVPAAAMRQSLERLGMQIVGCHINPLDLKRLPAVLDYHAELGNRQIGCDIEFFPLGDIDYVKRRCELFNRVGALCRERGMKYYYHNHFQEFQRIGDQAIYDIIMENTDPELVFAEMDTYWMARGGADPVERIGRYRDRLLLLHQKDFPADAPQPLCMFDGPVDPQQEISHAVFEQNVLPECFTEIGTGVLPIQQIIDAANGAPNLGYIVLEQDHTRLGELNSIRVSMEAFRKFRGIEFE